MDELFQEFIKSGAGFWFSFSEPRKSFVLKFCIKGKDGNIFELESCVDSTLDPQTTEELINKVIKDMIYEFAQKISSKRSEDQRNEV